MIKETTRVTATPVFVAMYPVASISLAPHWSRMRNELRESTSFGELPDEPPRLCRDPPVCRVDQRLYPHVVNNETSERWSGTRTHPPLTPCMQLGRQPPHC